MPPPQCLSFTTSSPTSIRLSNVDHRFNCPCDWRHHRRVANSTQLDHHRSSCAHWSDGDDHRSSTETPLPLGTTHRVPAAFGIRSLMGHNKVFWWPFGGLDLGTSDAAILSRGFTPLFARDRRRWVNGLDHEEKPTAIVGTAAIVDSRRKADLSMIILVRHGRTELNKIVAYKDASTQHLTK